MTCLLVRGQVYGTPMFDRALVRARGEGVDPLPGLLAALRAAPMLSGKRSAVAAAAAAAAATAAAAAAPVISNGGLGAALGNGTAAHASSGGSSRDDELAKRREQEARDAALARQLQEMDAESP